MKPALFLLLILLTAFAGASETAQEGHAENSATKELIYKTINFVIFFGGILWFIRKPVSEFLTARTAAIQREMLEAAAARREAEQRLNEILQRLNRLDEEIAAMRLEAQREDAVEAERARQNAGAEAKKILDNAESEIDTLTRAARLDLKAYASQLAVDLAQERIQQQMNPELQGRLVRAYVADLGDGKSKESN